MRQAITKATIALALVATGYVVGRAQTSFSIVSGVVPAEQAKVTETGPWGEFHTYFDSGTTATAAVLVGYADIQPGQQNHAPHSHMDEEFLYLVEGSGKWTVGDRTTSAKAGDVLYSAPNVVHGLRNSSDKPLKFFVVKWRSR
jgi:mannose-6-phosphate isomerase-like protein (cupin superfamily)